MTFTYHELSFRDKVSLDVEYIDDDNNEETEMIPVYFYRPNRFWARDVQTVIDQTLGDTDENKIGISDFLINAKALYRKTPLSSYGWVFI